MIDVGLRHGLGVAHAQAAKARQRQRVERGHRVDPDGPQAVRARLQHADHLVVRVPVAAQERLAGHGAEDPLAFGRRQSRQHVAVRCVHLQELAARAAADRQFVDVGFQPVFLTGGHRFVKVIPRAPLLAHEAIDAKAFLLEEYGAGEA